MLPDISHPHHSKNNCVSIRFKVRGASRRPLIWVWVGVIVSIRFKVRGASRLASIVMGIVTTMFQSALRFAVLPDLPMARTERPRPVSIRFKVRGASRRGWMKEVAGQQGFQSALRFAVLPDGVG